MARNPLVSGVEEQNRRMGRTNDPPVSGLGHIEFDGRNLGPCMMIKYDFRNPWNIKAVAEVLRIRRRLKQHLKAIKVCSK
jgi:hypothetical protein